MTNRPIIFSGPMVRALLAGRKTQTRRILKPQPLQYEVRVVDISAPFLDDDDGWGQLENVWRTDMNGTWEPYCEKWHPLRLRFAPGDLLWVRESFSYWHYDTDRDGMLPVWYWADGDPLEGDWTRPKPSIHMPRWASRLTLLVTDIRVQRLQAITTADAIAEGVSPAESPVPINTFAAFWNALPGATAWESDPWVVALTFTVHQFNIDSKPELSGAPVP